MERIVKFCVTPKLPAKLNGLLEIAYNLWWSWNSEAAFLFKRIDPDLWEITGHNPVKMLGQVREQRLLDLHDDDVFIAHLERIHRAFKRYMNTSTWYDTVHKEQLKSCIGYFSLEFGIHESIPIYSGGLGILAGDHLKSASELGLPLYGVGLMYRHGYFTQYLNYDGMQQEKYPENDFYNMPLSLEKNENGEPLKIFIDLPGRKVYAQIWRLNVGRINLYLLDTNIEENSPHDREITFQLYGGDHDMRIRQEILLGIGGLRALNAMGHPPTVCHLNEGHAAFLIIERIVQLMDNYNLTYEEARELVHATSVFTTHTPVPAGHDRFSPTMIEAYFHDYVSRLGLSLNEFLSLGRENKMDATEQFCMTVLALKLSSVSNGVSELHGKVSRKMWHSLWPNIDEDEIPIGHVTNGIHLQTWLSDEMARLYERYLGNQWIDKPVDYKIWNQVDNIPDTEMWRSHDRMKERLISFCRTKLKQQLKRRGVHHSKILEADEVLDPDALTIGFGRRFATYKRATLLLKDIDRLAKILNNPDKPVQFIFAGKAHPKDDPGKQLIRQIIHIARSDKFRRRIVFLEDYKIDVARYMVQGVDIWLNTPRRPLEASGTSGMKVPINGGLNLSIFDGWWCEGYRENNGWAIGNGEEYDDPDYQDEIESKALYDLLENDIIPLYYDRNNDGLPRKWCQQMKESIKTICPVFNTNRMVEQYTEQFYLPSILQWNWLSSDNMTKTRELTKWKNFIRQNWNKIKIEDVQLLSDTKIEVGAELPVNVQVYLGNISPDDVALELYYGNVNLNGEIEHNQIITLENIKNGNNPGHYTFKGKIRCTESGRYGFKLRIMPYIKGMTRKIQTDQLIWW